MAGSDIKVLQELQSRGKATRPQLAAATGLSLVTVTHVVEKLCRSGAVLTDAVIPSGGGRPVQQYRFNQSNGFHVLIHLEREGNILHGTLEELDLDGGVIRSQNGRFAYVDQESFDGWLDAVCRHHKPRSITLFSSAELRIKEIATHWEKRYGCTVRTPGAATLLAKTKEGEATLCLPEGENAHCTICRHGQLQESGALSLLPLPAEWKEINHSDRSLLEETVARMLQIITCILAPTRISLHAPAWSPRLMERMRYNASTKLRGQLPPIRFVPLSTEGTLRAVRCFIARHG